ncbi:beta strand repeat-containing protein, partial [Flavobacterium silvaticum]
MVENYNGFQGFIKASEIRTAFKKNWFLATFFLLFGLITTAQTVTIPAGNPTGTGSGAYLNKPFHGATDYAGFDAIYLASEIGTGPATINSIAFYVDAQTASVAVPVVVSMQNTSAATLSTASYANATATSTSVYSGTIPAVTAGGWVTITLSTPFSYSGGNLEVLIKSNYGTTATNEAAGARAFRWFTTTARGVVWERNNNATLRATDATAVSAVPHIRFGYTACSSLTLQANQGLNSASISCWNSSILVDGGSNGTPAFSYVTSAANPTSTVIPEGTGFYRFNSYSCDSGDQLRFSSPKIITTGTPSVDVSFKWLEGNGYPNYTDNVQVQYSLNGTTWVNAGSTINENNTVTQGWVSKTVTLPAAAGNQAFIYVGFLFTSNYGDNCHIDDIQIKASPSCQSPPAVASSAVGSSTATISWTAPTIAPTGGYEYEIRTAGAAGSGNTGLTTSGSTVAGDVDDNLTALTPNTAYTFYVRSSCGSGVFSAWSSAGTFTTTCIATSVPYTENFNSVTVPNLPSCTSRVTVSGNDWQTAAVSDSGFSSNALRYAWNTDAAANSWFFTQGLNLTAGTIYKLSYKYGNNDSTTYNEKLKVKYGTSASAAGMTLALADHPTINTATAATNEVYFTPPSTGVYYIGFNAYSIADQFYLYVDDISVILGPTCLSPSNVNLTAITTTTATINWTAPIGSPASYQYEVRSSGTAGSGATGLVASGSVNSPTVSATANGLTAGSVYSVYVKSTCGGSDQSAWTSAVTLRTLCNPTTTLPFTENFEGGILPACWSTQTVAGNTWAVTTTNNSTSAAHGGTNFMGLNSNTTTANNSVLYSPQFNFSAAAGSNPLRVNVWVYRGTDAAVADVITFSVNTSASTTGATDLAAISLRYTLSPVVAAAGWYNYTLNIPTSFNAAPFYIVVKGANAANANARSLSFDDFRIELLPPTINTLSPTSLCSAAATSTPITVTGTNLNQVTSVTLNGQSLTFTPVSATSIQVNLLADSQTGTITVTGPNGTATSPGAITITASPEVEPITGPSTVCQDSVITLTTASSAGTWSTSNPDVATVSGGFVTGVSAGTATISYTITSNGCTSAQSHVVTVSPKIVSDDPSSANALLNTPTEFTVHTSNAQTFQWQVSADGENFDDLTATAPFENVSGTVPVDGVVTLNITSATEDLNGLYFRVILTGTSPCSQFVSAGALLLVGQTGIVPGTPAPVTLCGQTTATFTVQTTGDVDFWNWYVNKNLGDGPQPIDALADGLTYDTSVNGTLVVDGISIANNGWIFYIEVGSTTFESSVFSSATLTVNQPVSIAPSGQPANQIGCGNQAGSKTFTVNATGSGLNYLWQYSATGIEGSFVNLPGTPPTGITYSGSSTATLTVNYSATTPGGLYYYRAVVGGSCGGANSNPASLQISNPNVTVNPPSATYCTPGTGVSLTASGAVSYTWSPATGLSATTGATVIATPSATTTYTVTGTDANNCSKSTTVTVTIGNGVAASASSNLQVVCSGGAVQLSAGGVQSYTTGAISGYTLAATTSPYTPVGSGATPLTELLGDDTETAAMQNIGFTFNYGGTNYTQFRPFSNGYISFASGSTTNVTNNLQNAGGGNRPIIAPLWDDLDGSVAGAYAGFEVTGSAPYRVMTMEWRNWEWDYTADAATISFQVKLYETSNIIEFAYRSEAGAYSNGGLTSGASIGMNAATGSGTGTYVNLSSISPATLTSTTNSTGINTKPASNTVYRFTPSSYPTFTYAWTSVPAGFTSNLQNPVANPTANTTYNVVVSSASGCSGNASTSVTIQSGATITSQPSPATVTKCQGEAISLSVAATGPGLTYQWKRNGANITGNASALTATLSVTSATPAMSGNYTVVVTPSCGAAATSDIVALTVYATPTVTAPAAQTACTGTPTSALNLTGAPTGVTFDITGGTLIGLANQTGVTSIPSFNPTFGVATITITPKANGCTGTPVTFTYTVNGTPQPLSVSPTSVTKCVTDAGVALTATGGMVQAITPIGTNSSTTSTTGISPFSALYEGSREQYLILASELTAAGIQPGQLSSLSFDVTASGSYPQNNFSIKLAHTAVTVMGAAYATPSTPFVTVYSSASEPTPAVGVKTFGFSTAFTWNGTSNILVDICHDNDTNATCTDCYGSTSTVRTTTTPARTVWGSYADDTASCGTQAANTISTYTTRPWMKFGATIQAPVIWTPAAGLYTTAAATTAYTAGSSALTVYAKPGSTSTYTATATPTAGCAVAATPVTVTVNQQYPFYVDADHDGFGTGSAVQICSTSASAVPSGYALVGGDCNDADATRWQSANLYVDTDGDGYTTSASSTSVCYGASIPAGYVTTSSGVDCNDTDASKWRSANLYVDADADGYGASASTTTICYGATIPAGYSATSLGIDCNDADATKHASFDFYADTDGDGFGFGSLVSVCAVNASTPPAGYSLNNTDCA